MKRLLNTILIVTGTLFILSLLTSSPLTLTICLTLFVMAIVINCYYLFKGEHIVNQICTKTTNNATTLYKNKRYIGALINIITTPMLIIGIICVILCLICMWINL